MSSCQTGEVLESRSDPSTPRYITVCITCVHAVSREGEPVYSGRAKHPQQQSICASRQINMGNFPMGLQISSENGISGEKDSPTALSKVEKKRRGGAESVPWTKTNAGSMSFPDRTCETRRRAAKNCPPVRTSAGERSGDQRRRICGEMRKGPQRAGGCVPRRGRRGEGRGTGL